MIASVASGGAADRVAATNLVQRSASGLRYACEIFIDIFRSAALHRRAPLSAESFFHKHNTVIGRSGPPTISAWI